MSTSGPRVPLSIWKDRGSLPQPDAASLPSLAPVIDSFPQGCSQWRPGPYNELGGGCGPPLPPVLRR